MKPRIKRVSYNLLGVDSATAPSYWASFLINGDASGMSDDEIAACEAWLKYLQPGPVCPDVPLVVGERHFSVVSCEDDGERYARFNGLLTQVTTYILHELEVSAIEYEDGSTVRE